MKQHSKQPRTQTVRITPRNDAPPPEVLVVRGFEYFIYWRDLLPGGSFFLPTTASAAEVRSALRPFARYWQMELKAHTRCEYGRYGVRVWRIR